MIFRLLVAFCCALVLAPAASAHHRIDYTLVGTQGTGGWYRSDVTIQWTMSHPADITASSGCEPGTRVTSEGPSTRTCSVTAGEHTVSLGVTVRIDKTAPTAGGAASRGPDANGWYNHPVAFTFSGTDSVSGIASCASPTYGGGDGAGVSVTGTCTDQAGNTSAPASVTLQYDATPPTVSAAPDGQPVAGWYRRPVTIGFSGADATSGIGACAAPVRYKGPDGDGAKVKGSCSDAAGNTAEAEFAFKYDATAPKLGKLRAARQPGSVRISWPGSKDYVSTQLVRKPGINGAKSSVVYRGKGSSYVDRRVDPGRRYRYELVVSDVAGNRSGRVATAKPLAPLYSPGAGQRVRGPLTLAWQKVAGARFYNLQLYRDGVKVLSHWPRGPSFRIPKAWRYGGKTQQLRPGRYVWYVWAARGTAEKPLFGRPLGRSTFVVRGGA